VRLLVARCEVRYSGRLNAVLPEAVRLLILKADGSVLVHDDAGGFKPLNWMTAPTSVEELGDTLVVRKLKTEDVLEIRLAEVLSDVVHDMGESAALQKDGVERDLQEELAAAPTAPAEERVPRHPRRAEAEAAGGRTRGVARHPLRRGRPSAAARGARARPHALS